MQSESSGRLPVNFDYQTHSITTESLTLEYFLVPWDTEIVGRPVAEISRLEVHDTAGASRDFVHFSHWCEDQQITLCSCRIDQKNLVESMFLEEQGFRFIELNYYPRLNQLQSLTFPEEDLIIDVASVSDRESLADMAATIFSHGRFHQDPRIPSRLGNHRYRTWLINGFTRPEQRVLKCLRGDEVIAFFVVEYPSVDHCFWSLVGLAPGLHGRGLGKRAWRTLLRWHQKERVETITTSISSHNIVAFNLYVSLGFRFPQPLLTLHWRPAGENAA